jgi:hypothetical protein
MIVNFRAHDINQDTQANLDIQVNNNNINRILLITNYGLIQFNYIDSNKLCLRMLLQHGKLIVSWVIPKTLYNFIGERKSIKNKINLIRFDSILHTMIH